MAGKGKKPGKITPLMKQYFETKQKYPHTLLLFRVGDFYETFGEDAVTAAKILGIVLTSRNNGGSDIELAGFPYHSLDMYLPRLVRAGYRVAICEQLEKPSKEKKIVKRGVTEVVTPGVVASDSILEQNRNNFLASVHYNPEGRQGLALLDLSTGEFFVAEGTPDYVEKIVQSFSPSEIIYSKGNESEVIRQFGEAYFRYALDDWIFSADFAYERLQDHFEVQSLKGFGIEDLPLGQISAGAVLQYLTMTENTALPHLQMIQRIVRSDHLWMDKFTVRNLELVQSPHAGGIPLIDVIDCTASPMGSRMLKKWLLLPLVDPKAIVERLDSVEMLVTNGRHREELKIQVEKTGDLERLISKISLGKANPRDILQLAHGLATILPIEEHIRSLDSRGLNQIAQSLNPCTAIKERIEREIVENPPVHIQKSEVIRDGVSDELDGYRHVIRNSRDMLVEIQQKEAEATGITNLKIGFNNVFGYYLEVTNKYKDQGLIPDEWIRKQTLTNAERYITEELKVLEEKILSAEEKAKVCERSLMDSLEKEILTFTKSIQINAHSIAYLDCLLSFATLAMRHDYCKPQLNDGLSISIKGGRHPVIESQMGPSEHYVPNDVHLDTEGTQIMMITGPNMSGKSAFLRQTALICIMAQMGSFVPADEAVIGWVDKLFTRVGASDNISTGESTFMVEMNETASILNNISARSLILLDEIGRGTSTYDGISIAWSIAEYLHQNKPAHPKTLFATHYHELNELANQFSRIKNFHIATRESGNQVVFLRKLEPGGSEHSFGIHVARMAGMPSSIVRRATELLFQLEQKRLNNGQTTRELINESLNEIQVGDFQLNIFEQHDPLAQEIVEELSQIDVNILTPIECMLKISELKTKLEAVLQS